ncbi:helix-turn-helix domain-containing protein [Streptacidiphilus rugosus]|uniref:helix-turn-helix domain-containing protein n=1 Tax=Streptacidiphilus rugosus TaxID=405783 RepID=UPI0018DE27FF|nr:helix-turn-helix transcriptional regulator [Streptacidiphilus rugosus]
MIRRRREELNWSQPQLAEAAGTAQSVVSRIESGRLNPTMDMVARLAEAMDSELRLTIESPLTGPGR